MYNTWIKKKKNDGLGPVRYILQKLFHAFWKDNIFSTSQPASLSYHMQ